MLQLKADCQRMTEYAGNAGLHDDELGTSVAADGSAHLHSSDK
jgi:hypothetical protein